MDNEKINVEKDNKKVVLLVGIVLSILVVLVFSATYAYFSVNTSNNFGNTTIDAAAESVGTVALNGNSANIRLNLSAVDMMKGENDITYWGTSDGTPSTTQNVVTIGSTEVTGAGYFNCTYTLNVTATGTNNMYTAFQGMSGKSTEQIVLKIGDTKYDFNTANLFPITINGILNGLSGSSSKSLTAEFYLVNKEGVIQDALEGKDLNITITATNFSCTAIEAPQIAYYTYDSSAEEGPNGMITSKLESPNSAWQYYIVETRAQTIAEENIYEIQYTQDNELLHFGVLSLGDCNNSISNAPTELNASCEVLYFAGETYTKVTNEVCAKFNNNSNGTVCLKPNDYANVDNYYTEMNNLGLSCNEYQKFGYLQCSNGSTASQSGSLMCNIVDRTVTCGIIDVGFCQSDGLITSECYE